MGFCIFQPFNNLFISISGYLCEKINNNSKMRQGKKLTKPGTMAAIVFAVIALFASCEKKSFIVETINPADSVHFQADIQPLFTTYCITCHKGTRNPNLTDGNSYNSLQTGGYITPTDSTCKLYVKIKSGHPSPTFAEADRQKIYIWIKQGAKNN
jgi:hypothetical protein